MPLPRNLISRNKNVHIKEGINKIIDKKKFELEKICNKHKICQLSFGPCKLININGSIINIEYQNIKCNMKSSVIILQIQNMIQDNDNIYDLIEIEKNKLLNDIKRQEETVEKTQLEFERNLTNDNKLNEHLNEIDNIDDKNLQNEQLIKINEDNEKKNELKESSHSEQITDINEEKKSEKNKIKESSHSEQITDINEEKTSQNDELKESSHSEQITDINEEKTSQNDELKESSHSEQITDINEEKKTSQNDNRYYRRFMDDIKKKFNLKKGNKYRYFEIKSSTTDFVIENPKTYIINISNDHNINYLLVIGDLILKSKLILKIDPGYKSEKVYKEHNEFFNRIKEKENKN